MKANQFLPYCIDALDERIALAIDSVYVAGGILNISANNAADVIEVSEKNGLISINDTGKRVALYDADAIARVVVNGAGGADRITVKVDLNSCILGGDGNDTLTSAGGKDTIYAGDGDDLIESGTNDDRLWGENGSDKIFGDEGFDRLYGGGGNDFLDGGTGGNSYDGGSGVDYQADRFVVDGGHLSDIQQRNSNTCVILASIGAAIDAGFNPSRLVSYEGDAIYSVKLFLNNVWKDIKVQFDGTLKSDDPASAVEGESWVIIMQRAWLKSGMRIASERDALAAVTGLPTSHIHTYRAGFDLTDFEAIRKAIAGNQAVTAGTFISRSKVPDARLIASHMYSVTAVSMIGNQRFITLQNPWGTNDKYAAGGSLTIKWEEFVKSFEVFHTAAR